MQNLCQGSSYKTFGFTRNLQTCKLTLWLLHVLTLIYWKTAHCKITKSNTNNYFKNMFKQHTKYTHVSTCIAYDSLQFSFLVIFLVISEKNNSYSWFFIASPFTFLQVFIIPTERIACTHIKNKTNQHINGDMYQCHLSSTFYNCNTLNESCKYIEESQC